MGKMKLESSPETKLDETVFWGKILVLFKKPSNLNETEHTGLPSRYNYTPKTFKMVLNLRKKLWKCVSFRSKKYEVSMVKQPKIALNTFYDIRCYNKNYGSVPCLYSKKEYGDEKVPTKYKIKKLNEYFCRQKI